MYIFIDDGMKKEGKIYRNVMVFGYLFSIIVPLFLIFSKSEGYTNKDIFLFFVGFFLLGSIGLYGWLYTLNYKIHITKEKIIINTLFKKSEVNMGEIICYSCKRYKKSLFYQFQLYTKKKKYLVNTRYRDEFIALLKENNIFQK